MKLAAQAGRSRTDHVRIGRSAPAHLREPTSQANASAAKATMLYSPVHLVDMAQPRQSAQPSRHGRNSNQRPGGPSANRMRIQSRSATRQPNAAITQNSTKMSRIPMRL